MAVKKAPVVVKGSLVENNGSQKSSLQKVPSMYGPGHLRSRRTPDNPSGDVEFCGNSIAFPTVTQKILDIWQVGLF